MKYLYTLLILLTIPLLAISQNEDEVMIKSLFDQALTSGKSYQMLDYLTNNIGARLSGSPQAAAAVEWSRQVMEQYGFDKVYLQEVMVPHWVRGPREKARIVNS